MHQRPKKQGQDIMDISDDILHIFHEDFFEYPTTGIYMQTKC